MKNAVLTAHYALVDLGAEFAATTEQGAKMLTFILAATEEVTKVAHAVFKKQKKIYERIAKGELHLLLADGIKSYGDMASHFAGETFKN